MARLWQSGAELNSTTNGVEFSSTNNASISSVIFRGGKYSLELDPSATTSGVSVNVPSGVTQDVFYIRFYCIVFY